MEFDDLPIEILEYILSYLPPYQELYKCKKVSKRWNEAVCNVLRRGGINFLKGLTNYCLSWTKHTPTESPPSARFAHAYCLHEDSMYVFGGNGSSSDTTFNDLWRFDLSKRQWIRPIPIGNNPSPKMAATMITYENKLILFGGWRSPSLRERLHCYDIKQNRWTLHRSLISPLSLGHHSASLHKDQMVIFGGYDCEEEQHMRSSDVWALNLKTFQWGKPRVFGCSVNTKPAARYGQIQIALDDYHLMIMGGTGGFNDFYDDCWILDMSKDIWYWNSIQVKNSKWAAAQINNSSACRVGNKIVVCGENMSNPIILGMFVCDISNILNAEDPCIEWLEYKNYGILPGAPERLIFSSMVAGKNELILFGGVQKQSLGTSQNKVSNSVHFLGVPKKII